MITASEALVSSSLNFLLLDPLSEAPARETFKELQGKGVIEPMETFDDDVWHTTDKYDHVGLHFEFDEFSYKKNYEKIFNLSLFRFKSAVKCYVLSQFGFLALRSLENLILDIRHITETDPDKLIDHAAKMSICHPRRCGDFLTLLNGGDEDRIGDIAGALDECEETYELAASGDNPDNKRTLADMDTYFTFGDIMKDFWKQNLPADVRMFYFPLYIWWNLTGCIPLRPKELLLTPRDCIYEDNLPHRYHLKIRRDILKGSNTKKSYDIGKDTRIQILDIPESLYREIKKYQEATGKDAKNDINTLFVMDSHYEKWGKTPGKNNRHFTYTNLRTVLKYFMIEVICGRYGYTIVAKKSGHLGTKEMQPIRLGDCRHIAMINLMREGGTPVTAMLLSGHTNDEMASHYYTNLCTLTECETYRMHQRILGTDTPYEVSFPVSPSIRLSAGVPAPSEYGGLCYSGKYAEGCFDDCYEAVGDHGEVGCCRACPLHRKNGVSIQDCGQYKAELKKGVDGLMRAVELVRSERGAEEDLGEAILRLRAGTLTYQKFLLAKQGMKDGKEEADEDKVHLE